MPLLTRTGSRDHGGRPECPRETYGKGGGGGKAGDHGVDAREGAEQATFSPCGKRTVRDKAGN